MIVQDLKEILPNIHNGAPVLVEKTKNGGKALASTSQRNYTTLEIAQERLDICQSCEFLFKKTNTCKKCGCFMDAKTRIKGHMPHR